MSSLNWGLLSTARINDALLHAGVNAVAVASRDEAKAKAYARGARDRARPTGPTRRCSPTRTIDIIYNSLPNSMHLPWAIRALEAGKHVLCEKPLSRRAADVEAAFDVARARRPGPDRGLHVAPPPAGRARPGAGRRRRDRHAARDPQRLRVQPAGHDRRPDAARDGRRRADGRRQLLRVGVAHVRGRRAGRGAGAADRRRRRRRPRAHRACCGSTATCWRRSTARSPAPRATSWSCWAARARCASPTRGTRAATR